MNLDDYRMDLVNNHDMTMDLEVSLLNDFDSIMSSAGGGCVGNAADVAHFDSSPSLVSGGATCYNSQHGADFTDIHQDNLSTCLMSSPLNEPSYCDLVPSDNIGITPRHGLMTPPVSFEFDNDGVSFLGDKLYPSFNGNGMTQINLDSPRIHMNMAKLLRQDAKPDYPSPSVTANSSPLSVTKAVNQPTMINFHEAVRPSMIFNEPPCYNLPSILLHNGNDDAIQQVDSSQMNRNDSNQLNNHNTLSGDNGLNRLPFGHREREITNAGHFTPNASPKSDAGDLITSNNHHVGGSSRSEQASSPALSQQTDSSNNSAASGSMLIKQVAPRYFQRRRQPASAPPASSTSGSNGKVAPAAKTHQCQFCVAKFARRHDLKRHLRIHLGIKPYECYQCGKTFSRRDALSKHQTGKRCKGAPLIN